MCGLLNSPAKPACVTCVSSHVYSQAAHQYRCTVGLCTILVTTVYTRETLRCHGAQLQQEIDRHTVNMSTPKLSIQYGQQYTFFSVYFYQLILQFSFYQMSSPMFKWMMNNIQILFAIPLLISDKTLFILLQHLIAVFTKCRFIYVTNGHRCFYRQQDWTVFGIQKTVPQYSSYYLLAS